MVLLILMVVLVLAAVLTRELGNVHLVDVLLVAIPTQQRMSVLGVIGREHGGEGRRVSAGRSIGRRRIVGGEADARVSEG